MSEWSADALVDLQSFYRAGGASHVSSAVEQLLGRKPIPFPQFVRELAAAFRT